MKKSVKTHICRCEIFANSTSANCESANDAVHELTRATSKSGLIREYFASAARIRTRFNALKVSPPLFPNGVMARTMQYWWHFWYLNIRNHPGKVDQLVEQTHKRLSSWSALFDHSLPFQAEVIAETGRNEFHTILFLDDHTSFRAKRIVITKNADWSRDSYFESFNLRQSWPIPWTQNSNCYYSRLDGHESFYSGFNERESFAIVVRILSGLLILSNGHLMQVVTIALFWFIRIRNRPTAIKPIDTWRMRTILVCVQSDLSDSGCDPFALLIF